MEPTPHVYYPAVPLAVRQAHAPAKILGAWSDAALQHCPHPMTTNTFEVLLYLEDVGGTTRWWVEETFLVMRSTYDSRTGARTLEGGELLKSEPQELRSVGEWFIFNHWSADEVPAEVKRYRPVGNEMPLPDTPSQEDLIPRLRAFCNDADTLLRAQALRRSPFAPHGGAEETFKELRERAKVLVEHVRRHYNAASTENVPHGWGETWVARRKAGTQKELDREEGLKKIQEAILPIALNWPDKPSQDVITGRRVKGIREGMRLLGRGLGLESPSFIGTRLVSKEVVTYTRDEIFGPRPKTGVVVTPRMPTPEEERAADDSSGGRVPQVTGTLFGAKKILATLGIEGIGWKAWSRRAKSDPKCPIRFGVGRGKPPEVDKAKLLAWKQEAEVKAAAQAEGASSATGDRAIEKPIPAGRKGEIIPDGRNPHSLTVKPRRADFGKERKEKKG